MLGFVVAFSFFRDWSDVTRAKQCCNIKRYRKRRACLDPTLERVVGCVVRLGNFDVPDEEANPFSMDVAVRPRSLHSAYDSTKK